MVAVDIESRIYQSRADLLRQQQREHLKPCLTTSRDKILKIIDNAIDLYGTTGQPVSSLVINGERHYLQGAEATLFDSTGKLPDSSPKDFPEERGSQPKPITASEARRRENIRLAPPSIRSRFE